MQICDVCKNVEKAGLAKHPNDEINTTLVRMGRGKFSLTEKFELAVVGVKPQEMQDMALCAKQVVDQDFKGDAVKALAFMQQMNNTGISRLDFNTMVHQGTAHRLIALSESDPAAFNKVVSEKYTDIAQLNAALGVPRQQAMLANTTKFAPATA